MDGLNNPVTELVHAALAGEQQAWDDLVGRYTPLVLSVTARHRLSRADAADVAQTVWLRLLQHLGDLREPRALPGWILTTSRNECLRVLGGENRERVVDPFTDPRLNAPAPLPDVEDGLVRWERHEALLAAFAELSQRHRELLLLLVADPPWSYLEISSQLGMPIGAIGPTRARALDRLRCSPALSRLMQNERL